MRKIRILPRLFLLLALSLIAAPMQAADYNDQAALAGIQQGKGLFLVDINNPKKTALYLDIITGTHAGMKRQGVTPDFKVVYIGPTVRFLTQEPEDVLEMEYEAELASIQESIQKLDELGVTQEVCSIATKVFEVDNASLPGSMDIIGDGFISLIGYQAQGYHLVPIY